MAAVQRPAGGNLHARLALPLWSIGIVDAVSQTYLNWNLTTPDPAVINVEEICYKGLLHLNVSCKAPPPAAN
jgi:hypothetical protein